MDMLPLLALLYKPNRGNNHKVEMCNNVIVAVILLLFESLSSHSSYILKNGCLMSKKFTVVK